MSANRPAHYARYRLALLISIGLVIPLGLLLKFYRGPGQAWFNNSFAGVPYEIFWILLIAVLWPRWSPWRIALGVCLATCAVEGLQLWHPPWLEVLRAHLLGRLVLGTSFSWSDFPYYVVGSALGWGWVRSLQQHYS